MRLHGLLDFARAQPMPGNVDDVVGAAEDEVIPLFVPCGPVKRRIHLPAGQGAKIGIDKPLVVAPYGRHAARRQRRLDGQHAFFVHADFRTRRLVQ